MESMQLLASAGEVVLTPGVVKSLLHPRLAKVIFPVSALYDLDCVSAIKII
jgi:hypothetical protein